VSFFLVLRKPRGLSISGFKLLVPVLLLIKTEEKYRNVPFCVLWFLVCVVGETGSRTLIRVLYDMPKTPQLQLQHKNH
jgi:hypothetical protein